MSYKSQKVILILFIIAAMSFYWYGCSQESEKEGVKEQAEAVQVEKTYNFLDNLGSAEITARKADYVKVETEFAINNDKREVLFEHPDSEVVFKDVPISENTALKFGIGINQTVWDKSEAGDGVLFEIITIDERSQNTLLFLRYIDPKNNVGDRKWFDEQIDLSAFAGQKVSFTFKTTGGSYKDKIYDWAGWSRPQLVTYSEISRAEQPRTNVIISSDWFGRSRPQVVSSRKMGGAEKTQHINVILISIDTLRPDHLSAYGYKKATSPNIDSLAKEGVLFKNTIAQSDWTLPSHMSLLTSLYPSVHKVNTGTKLDSSRITLGEVLKGNEYYTAAFVDFDYLSHKYGFDQGFEIYDDQNRRGFVGGGIAKINPKVFEFLDKKYKEKFFLFIHIFDAHAPYEPPSPYNGMFYSGNKHDPNNHSLDFVKKLGYHNSLKLDGITDLEYVISSYNGEIAYVDNELDKLFNRLRELKIFDNTLIVITSDHGESLFDHQIWVGHGLFLYDDEIKIPLVMKLPKSTFKNTVIEEQVQSIDIAPTVLDILGIPITEQFQGRSLFPLIKGERNREEKLYAFGESSNTGAKFIRTNKWKFISRIQDIDEVIRIHLRPLDNVNIVDHIIEGEQLYDLENDPLEQHNLINQEIEEANELRGKLMKWIGANVEFAARLEFESKAKYGVKSSSESNKVDLTEEEKERLKSLGYVQ
jgi:arylsulfatase A-like enzyme